AADIRAVVYNSAGLPVCNAFTVNTTTVGQQGESHVVSLDDGGFLVSWKDKSHDQVLAQRFDGTGNKLGTEIQLHQGSNTFETSLATLSDGRVVASIDDFASGGNYDVYNILLDTRTNTVNHVTGANFFGGGTSDFLITRTDPGGNTSGGTMQLYGLGTDGGLGKIRDVGTDWAIDGAGDMNGDGRADLLIHHDTGATRDLWLFRTGATEVVSTTKLGTVGTDWQVSGIGDFTHDGINDVLIAKDNGNNTRTLTVLTVQNETTAAVTQAGVVTSDWVVDGVGDMTKDGTADILMHYDDAGGRHLQTLNMQNAVARSVINTGLVGKEWQIDGLGDFDGDGDKDVLLHFDDATSRNIAILTIENGATTLARTVGPVGKNIQIDGIGDFNGDGVADIGVHYDTATSRIELVIGIRDGGTVTGISEVGVLNHDWLIG
ncbi:MAG: VCBS repeat-containing protein, partial [Methylobacteriaceae bacterium]|nr:VCBS repeat-containing protein [Methylobacteriaceae bacterium]